MKRWSAFATAMLFRRCRRFSYSQQASGQADKGWVTLFDGQSLDNWTQIATQLEAGDGVVAADKGNGFLVSKDSLRRLPDQSGNSGSRPKPTAAFSSAARSRQGHGKNAYEVNIFDKRPTRPTAPARSSTPPRPGPC